jgi:hypothetical protein
MGSYNVVDSSEAITAAQVPTLNVHNVATVLA